jgi:hypothetical protein
VSTRDAIAAALSTVDGVVGSPAPPDVVTHGSAWPTWVQAATGTYCTLTDTWHVFVVLPNANAAATVEGSDQLVDAVWGVLLDIGEVSVVDAATITPADPAGAGQSLPALRYTLTTTGAKT